MTRAGDATEASNSEIQAFLDCGRRWWLSYYRRLVPREEKLTGPLAIGSRVHKTLEEGYSSPGRGEAALALLAKTIEEDIPKAEALGVEKEFLSEAELCVIMVEGFIDWAAEEGLDAAFEVVAHERIVRTPPIDVLGEPVILKGKLDQMVRRLSDGALMMRDWKTTQEKAPAMLQFRPQLKTYLLLLALTEPDAQVAHGQFVFLRKVKRSARAVPPFYYDETLYVSPREMETFWAQTMGTLGRMVEVQRALDAGADHHSVVPPRPTRDCSWRCPFFSCCEMFDDGSNVEGYLDANYVGGDPYAYYGLDSGKEGEAE